MFRAYSWFAVAAILDERTFCFVIQHGRHAIVFMDLQGFVANQEFRRRIFFLVLSSFGIHDA